MKSFRSNTDLRGGVRRSPDPFRWGGSLSGDSTGVRLPLGVRRGTGGGLGDAVRAPSSQTHVRPHPRTHGGGGGPETPTATAGTTGTNLVGYPPLTEWVVLRIRLVRVSRRKDLGEGPEVLLRPLESTGEDNIDGQGLLSGTGPGRKPPLVPTSQVDLRYGA